MALKSFPKDYLLSSTPQQSPGDSGYFGSGQRRNNAVLLSSCSPIKESNHKNDAENVHFMHGLSPKVTQNLNFLSLTKNESLSSVEVNDLSELEFTSPDFSSPFELYKTSQSSSKEGQKIHSDQYDSYSSEYIASTSNSFSVNDIHYKLFDFVGNDQICESKGVIIFGQRKVDIISKLAEKNCYSLISYILSFLSAKELCIASCVSKEWNKVILDDSKANERRQNLVNERLTFLNGPSKENRKGMKYGPAKEHKNFLSDISNVKRSFSSAEVKVSNDRFDSFLKESRNSMSKLLKCPRCLRASKKHSGNRYMCTRCYYNFCSNCLDPFTINHVCYFKPPVPNVIVGSKKSKRNLRRL